VIRYLVTTYAGREGANLSRPGDWGNIPYPSVEEARAAAKEDAGAAAYSVEVSRYVSPNKRK
jgi:hypothetical protein